MKYWIYILFFWSVVTISCDPCNECGEPLLYEPTVAVTFINQDSITALDTAVSDSSVTIQYYDSISQELNKEIDSLEGEVARISDSIQNGNTEYEDSLELVSQMIEDLGLQLLPVEKKLADLDSIVGVYNDIIKTINSGLLQVDKVTVLNTGGEITYEDSMKTYNLPLIMDFDQSQTDYQIVIKEKSFTFSLVYELSETLNDARVFKVIASNIQALENYTCDTLIFTCPNDICISNETIITAIY